MVPYERLLYPGSTVIGGTGGSTVYLATARERTFNSYGFGYNDPRLKIVPTEGQYHITDFTYPRGSARTDLYYVADNTHAGYGFENGVMGSLTSHLLLHSPEWWASNYNNALSKLYDGIRDSNANIALSVGEGKETAAMLKKALSAMGDLISQARRFRRRFIHQPSKVLAEAWLNAKLGWLPLYKDVYAYLEWTTRRFDSQTFEGKKTYSERVSETHQYGTLKYVLSGVKKHQCLISVTCKVGDPNAFNVSRISSLNPISIAWELVPFSFVFDYFVNVSAYLQNQEAALGAGLVFEHGFITDVLIWEGSETAHQSDTYVAGSYRAIRRTYATSKIKKVSKYRWRLHSFPMPMPPTLGVKLGWQRILTLTALFRKTLLGKV